MSDIDPNAQESTTPGDAFPPGTYSNPGLNDWIQQNPGSADPSRSPVQYGVATNGAGEPIPPGDPSAHGTPASTTSPKGYSLDGLSIGIGSDGKFHVFGELRTLVADPTDPKKSIYGYQDDDLGSADNLAAVSANSGLPFGALQNRVDELQVQQGQLGAGLTRLGQYTVAGLDQNGNLQVYDSNHNLTTVTAAQAQAGQIPGVAYADYQQARAQYLTNLRTTTQAGQYSVQGKNADGSYNVVDYNGKITPIWGPQLQQYVAQGQVPGVSQSMLANADAEYANTQRTNTEAGQYSVTQAAFAPNGSLMYYVKDYNGNITPFYGPQLQQYVAAGQVPGVTLSDLQQAQYHAQDMAFQLSPVNTSANPSPYFGNGYGQAPTANSAALTAYTLNPSGQASGSQPSTPAPNATASTPASGSAQASGTTGSGSGTTGSGSASNNALAAYSQAASAYTQQQQTNQAQSAYANPSSQGSAGGSMMATQGYPTTQGTPTPSSASAPATNTLSAYSNPAPSALDTMTHQQQQQMNQAYQQNVTMTTAENAGQSRNMSGLGFSGVQRPQLAGWG